MTLQPARRASRIAAGDCVFVASRIVTSSGRRAAARAASPTSARTAATRCVIEVEPPTSRPAAIPAAYEANRDRNGRPDRPW